MKRSSGGAVIAGGPRRRREGASPNYDLLYNPRFSVPDFPQYAARWSLESERARTSLPVILDVPYGSAESEKLDLFRAEGQNRAMLVFIHGGYWRMLDKRDFSFVAPAFVRSGVAVAIPNYALCPRVGVRDIVMQMVQACAWLYRHGTRFGVPRDSLYVCGHSAGGHLAAMMLACLWPVYCAQLPHKLVQAAFSVSGLYDLTDIVRTPSINCDVRLDEENAVAASPALLGPATDAPLHIAVGERETGGFHLQRDIIRRRWERVLGTDLICPGLHHYSILDEFCQPAGALHGAVLGMMGLGTGP